MFAVRQEKKDHLSLLVLLSLLGLGLGRRGSLSGIASRVVFGAALISVYLFKAASGSLSLPSCVASLVSPQGVVEARAAYLCVFFILLYTVWSKIRTSHSPADKNSPSLQPRNKDDKDDQQQNLALSARPCKSVRKGVISKQEDCATRGIVPPRLVNDNKQGDCATRGIVPPRLVNNNKQGDCATRGIVPPRLVNDNKQERSRAQSSERDTSFHTTTFHVEGSLPKCHSHQSLFKDGTTWDMIQTVWLCVMCLLLRPHNIVIVCMVAVIEGLVQRLVVPLLSPCPTSIFLYCFMMGQACFFFQGNSNSLSTVDVSAGMAALNNYQPVVCGLQLCLATYSAVIFWMLSAGKYVCSTSSNSSQLTDVLADLSSTALLTRALPLAVYTVLVTAMRHHLFVWTVFSPKLLYEGTLTVAVAAFCGMCTLIAHTLRIRSTQ